MAGRARGLVLLVRDPLCRGIMQIYEDLINIIALYLTSIRRIPRRGMRPDFGSGGVARPLSALLRLAMLARRLAARHRPPKLGSGAESITRLQDMMRCVIVPRCDSHRNCVRRTRLIRASNRFDPLARSIRSNLPQCFTAGAMLSPPLILGIVTVTS